MQKMVPLTMCLDRKLPCDQLEMSCMWKIPGGLNYALVCEWTFFSSADNILKYFFFYFSKKTGFDKSVFYER